MNGLIFLNPWMLAGLIFLPALWYLLRITPPAPRIIRFPAARFLVGLQAAEQTPRHTPWPILLLRMLCAVLLILALARPILHPAADLPGHGPVRLVIDNGWAAAPNWDTMRDTATQLIHRAGRAERPIILMTTALQPDGGKPVSFGPFSEGEARAVLAGFHPYPWVATYDAASSVAHNLSTHEDIATFWLSTGLQDNDSHPFIQQLMQQGSLTVLIPPAERLAMRLRDATAHDGGLGITIDLPPGINSKTTVAVEALRDDGHLLDLEEASAGAHDSTANLTFNLPANIQRQIGKFRLAGQSSAGGILLLDDRFHRRTIGLVTVSGQEKTALVDENFYVRQALTPYADITAGPLKELLAKKTAAIIMPDTGAMPADELEALEKWVRAGGLLLRFAGPNMTQGQNFLTPVPLRLGGRAMSGALTWDKPLRLAPFPPASPFAGLSIPPDLTVTRELLAEPVPGIEKMTWAALSDGTPLVTASALDRGMLVLVHTTATPQWSNLALSGLFVQMLQRTINLAGQSVGDTKTGNGALQPRLILDGFGVSGQPNGFVQPIAGNAFDATLPSPQHPPGLYARPGYQTALNLGERLPTLTRLSLPDDVPQNVYNEHPNERDLLSKLLSSAFAIFLLDWFIMLAAQRDWLTRARRWRAVVAALLIFIGTAGIAQAADNRAEDYSGDLYLAYLKTGNAAIDAQSEAGLQALATVLTKRTSIDKASVMAVDPARDELAFFPLLYWPVMAGEPPLTPAALRNVQNYLDHGGTIFFDIKDQASQADNAALQTLTRGLNIPALIPIPATHVLTKSFYLLRDFPVRYDEGALWVEGDSAQGRDGVSSVIVGNHDWAADWGGAAANANPQGEMALRFGVNLALYALTGNYKSDQVHMPEIMKRLGQ